MTATVPFASAAPPESPAGLSVAQPNDATTLMSWVHVPTATKYEVQVDDDLAFMSPEVNATTVNSTYVPTVNLKNGTTHWRVRSVNSDNERSAWSTSTFGTAAVSVPVPVAPTNGATLAQPQNPPLLSWTASPGAVSYTVEVDGDDDFVGAFSYSTQTTSLVVPDPLGDGDWFWRVTASKGGGLTSLPSATSSFIIKPIDTPTRISPRDDANLELQDVVLDWAPVPGAKTYDVQVATNTDFTVGGSLVEDKRGILGTRYSPTVTYNNNQYFWRVRAVDQAGQATPWTAARSSFNRTWPNVPTPVFPAEAGIETVPAPLYFQWESVRHASEYEVQVGTQENFSVGTFESCRTAGTTYTPGMFAINTTGQLSTTRQNEDCEPVAGEINYWRVRALDRPFTKSGDIPGIQGIFTEAQAFFYQPVSITSMTPTGGATVDVPTLKWAPVTGAETYDIKILRANGTTADSAKTSSTSYTPDGTTRLDPANNPHRWQITANTTEGGRSVTYTNSFNVSGNIPSSGQPALTPLTPTASTPGIQDAPSLTWAPMPGADHYTVHIGPAMEDGQVWFGHGSGDLFGQPVPYPAMTETSKKILLPGQYDWRVTAYDEDNLPIGTGPEGRFTVQPLVASSGQALAIDGRELDANFAGTKTPCAPGDECVVPTTPVLKWKADPRAAFYMVYVSEDSSFTNLLEPSNAIPATTNSMYAPALDNRAHTYADNQAGQAYHWYVRPCRTVLNCGPDPVSTTGQAQQSFVKQSPAVTGLQSTDPAGTELTFSWDDYWYTNRQATWPKTLELRPQAAKQYRIQVDDDLSFAGTLIDDRLVDQTTYTAFDRLYPEGTLHWRVQAVDSDDNGLTWSEVKTFTKQSPQVTLTLPVDQQVVTGTTPFRWQAQAFASSYDIEVYKNNDATMSTANRVISKTGVKTPAYAHNTPLPASSQPYVWRVRRTDADGNKGPWSSPGRFVVGTGGVELIAPGDGGSQAPNAPVLQWNPKQGATTYDLTVRSASGSGTSINATTPASAYAAMVNVATGTYVWTVTAKDSGNNVIGASSATFSVDAGLSAIQAPVIQALGGTGVGQTLTSVAPAWNQAGVTETYQWLRDGSTISGATQPTYVLTTADYQKPISLRVTAKKPGFSDGVTISNIIGATAGGALQAVTQPAITGTPAVGSTLRASVGTWSQPSPSLAYQWLRTGAPIPGATGTSYRLTPEDAGKNVAVTVLASKAGFTDGSASAPAVSVPKMKSTTAATLSKTRVKVGKRVKIGITVAVPGVKGPTGSIKIFDGAKKLKTLTLVSTRDGKIGWKLPKLKKGKHKIKAVYLGNGSTAGSKSKRIKLYVVR
ncbi:Ig-like domain repeat protein [Nocardioides sediminis]|uniref:Ig-like domain repeat protein n=1 Tax=Nocardioides sediminis TaxID=433648 RepID=UPI00131F199D|nr:Ig-like domain repeat protein [Nocardioides sediminis]